MTNTVHLMGTYTKLQTYDLEVPIKYEGVSEKSDIITPKSKTSMVFLGDQSILHLTFKAQVRTSK